MIDTSLHRSSARLVAFGNILLARTRSLHHLVDGAVANLRQVMLYEIKRDVVDAFRLLEGDKVFVVTFGCKEFVVIGHDERDENYGNDERM